MADSAPVVPPPAAVEPAQPQDVVEAVAPAQDSVATEATLAAPSDVAAGQSDAAAPAPALDAPEPDPAAASAGAPEAVTAPLAESAAVSAPVPAPETARSSSVVSTPVFDTGPRHPNDAAPGRITKGGSLLTGGYLAHKIYVGNLPESATLADLEDCFGQIGPCACQIKRGFGFVEYEDPAHAAEAVAKYNEGHFLGSQIKVELSLARTDLPKESLQQLKGVRGERPDRKGYGAGGSRGGRGGRNGTGFDRYTGPPPPSYAPPYGGGRYEDRAPPVERGYGPPRDERYGAPPRVDYRSAPPPAPYGAPVDRPPYDPYYAAYPPAAVPGYPPPPAAPYDRPPYAPPMPLAPPVGVRDPYGSERYPPPPGAARSPVMAAPYDAARGGMPPPMPGAGYPLDPYGRPAPLDPMSAPYDPRDDRGAGARYQPYPSRDERYGGRSPGRGAPGLERRRSMSPRRNGVPPDPYARDPYASSGYPAPYDARGPPPPPSAYGAGAYGGRSPPRYPPVDEYIPRR